MPLPEEIRSLAEELVKGTDDVADLADAARIYRRERMVILGMAAVDSMINGSEIDENDPRLLRVQEPRATA